MRAILVLALLALGHARAEACACCDATTSRTIVGWSDDVVMLDVATTTACEPRRMLELYRIDSIEPGGCYDLHGDPDKRIACEQVTYQDDPKRRARPSKRVALYKRRTPPLTPSQLVSQLRSEPDGMRLLVTINGKLVLSEVLPGLGDGERVVVNGWPTPKADGALLLLAYREGGSGNEVVEVRWAAMPAQRRR